MGDPAHPTARAILIRVWSFYCDKNTFTATFKQRDWKPAENAAQHSEGTVSFKRPTRSTFRYEATGRAVFSDGKYVQGYDEANRQMYERGAAKSQYPAVLAFLSGHLPEAYKVRKLNAKRMKYEGGYVIEATPREPSPAYAKILLYVEHETYQVRRVMLLDEYGTRNRFDFMEPRYDVDIPDSEFVLNVPDDIEVVRPWE